MQQIIVRLLHHEKGVEALTPVDMSKPGCLVERAVGYVPGDLGEEVVVHVHGDLLRGARPLDGDHLVLGAVPRVLFAVSVRDHAEFAGDYLGKLPGSAAKKKG